MRKGEQLAYAVSLITQGRWRFYTLTIPSDVLAQCCYVSDRFENPTEGFQRRLDRKRAQEIADYIDSGLGTIPSPVILSAQEAAKFQVTGRGKTVRFKFMPKAFLVLDGQHRVFGYSLAETVLRVPVVIYSNLSKEDEVKLFIDINTKQRPVSNELLLDIKRLASYEKPDEKFLGELFDEFDKNPESVLLGWLSKAERQKGRISRVTFNTAVRPTLARFGSRDVEAIFPSLNSYLSAVRGHLDGIDATDAIADSTVFKAFFYIFPRVARIVNDRVGNDFSDEDFSDALEPIFRKRRANLLDRPGKAFKVLGDKFLKRIDDEPLL